MRECMCRRVGVFGCVGVLKACDRVYGHACMCVYVSTCACVCA